MERRANESGGSGSSRQYNRDPKGTSTGGQFTSGSATQSAANTPTHIYGPRPKKGGGGGADPKAGLPASSRFKTLAPGADNDPAAVADMQRLLSALGFGNLNASGEYDQATQDAVKAVQARLGMKKPNGRADKSLVNKLLTAYDLSPCVQR